ncbi:MAG: hypothetical protein ACOY4R_05575 [Pseudomonadota bacterium]
MEKPEMKEPGPSGPSAWRLTFSYNGENIELMSQEHVEMTAPPSDPEDAGGVHLEVRDAGDRVVWRKRIRDPIIRDRAVFSPDPGEPIRRVDMPEPQGAFQVVVPDLPGAETFVLQGQPSSPATADRRGSALTMEATRPSRREMVRIRLARTDDRDKDTP